MSLLNQTKIQLRNLTSDQPEESFDHSKCFKTTDKAKLINTAKGLLLPQKQKSDTTHSSGKRPLSNQDVELVPDVKRQLLNSGETVQKPNSNKEYPCVLCLGTGAAIPSKYRNVSATLLQMRFQYTFKKLHKILELSMYFTSIQSMCNNGEIIYNCDHPHEKDKLHKTHMKINCEIIGEIYFNF